MPDLLTVSKIAKYFFPPLPLGRLARLDFRRNLPTRALEDISFSLGQGKILAILGPNGSGKTTLLKIISTLILPDKGTITFSLPHNHSLPGTSATTLTWPASRLSLAATEEKIKSSLGLLLGEERSFYWRLSGRQNLEFFAALYGLSKKTSQARIAELFRVFEVDYGQRRFDTYSTGMKRRFALMRSLLHDPELLLLDEPTRSLDYLSALNLRTFIKETLVKKSGKTVFFATHDMEEIDKFCDVVMILYKGRLCAIGTPEELRKKTGNPQARIGEIFLSLTGQTDHV